MSQGAPIGSSPASPEGTPSEITRLLGDAAHGNKDALDRLLPLVYDELRRIAHARLRSERAGHTLNTTALVHDAYLKLVDQTRVEWRSRSHFFAVASEAMRRILVDYAKRRQAGKRGGGAGHVPLDVVEHLLPADVPLTDDQATELIALNEALERLAAFNPQGALVVQYRFFGGLENDEVAEVMATSERTVRRAWTIARAWLRRELADAVAGGQATLLHPLESAS